MASEAEELLEQMRQQFDGDTAPSEEFLLRVRTHLKTADYKQAGAVVNSYVFGRWLKKWRNHIMQVMGELERQRKLT